MTPRRPTIILRQMTSHLSTKFHELLNRARKSGKGSDVCCSERALIAVDARTLASSVIDERTSANSSRMGSTSTGCMDDLFEGLVSGGNLGDHTNGLYGF